MLADKSVCPIADASKTLLTHNHFLSHCVSTGQESQKKVWLSGQLLHNILVTRISSMKSTLLPSWGLLLTPPLANGVVYSLKMAGYFLPSLYVWLAQIPGKSAIYPYSDDIGRWKMEVDKVDGKWEELWGGSSCCTSTAMVSSRVAEFKCTYVGWLYSQVKKPTRKAVDDIRLIGKKIILCAFKPPRKHCSIMYYFTHYPIESFNAATLLLLYSKTSYKVAMCKHGGVWKYLIQGDGDWWWES